MGNFSASNLATELTESWINGNKTHVLTTIRELPSGRAAAVTAYVCDYLRPQDGGDAFPYNAFVRAIGEAPEAPTVRAKHKRYSVEAGRLICRDGKPFVNVTRSEGRATPVEADALTRKIVALLNR
jgi:hypothetical protein